jgi:hypothetical protein
VKAIQQGYHVRAPGDPGRKIGKGGVSGHRVARRQARRKRADVDSTLGEKTSGGQERSRSAVTWQARESIRLTA